MKLNIVETTPLSALNVKLKHGWSNPNGLDSEYADFEKDVFSIPQANGEIIYIQQVVTFNAPMGDGDYTVAYLTLKQNNPDGDHDESSSVPLTIDAAIDLVFERL